MSRLLGSVLFISTIREIWFIWYLLVSVLYLLRYFVFPLIPRLARCLMELIRSEKIKFVQEQAKIMQMTRKEKSLMKNHRHTFASLESLSNNVGDIWKLNESLGSLDLCISFHRLGEVDLFVIFLLWHTRYLKGHILLDKVSIK